MAVVSCDLARSWRGSGDFKHRRQYFQVWEVTTDDPADGPAVVAAAAALPRRGQPYICGNDADPYARCVSSEPEQSADSDTLWTVNVTFDTQLDFPGGLQPSASGHQTTDPKDVPENPLLRPPQWKVSFQSVEEAVSQGLDKNGNVVAIVNSAGFPYNPPLTIPVSYPVVAVTVNRPDLDFAAIWGLQGAVNKTAWSGLPARSCRIVGAEASNKFENNIPYCEATYQFAIRNPNWDKVILDAGYMQIMAKPGGGFQAVKIIDTSGREPTEPYPLDGFGHALPFGAAPKWNTFRIYPEVEFSNFIF